MGWFDKSKRQGAAERLFEEGIYEVVAEEIQAGQMRAGLWAKALAETQGDEKRAKAKYIEFRVQSLKDEMVIELEARKREEDARLRAEELAKRSEIDKAIDLLHSKGYVVQSNSNGWKVKEPMGGVQKISNEQELVEYAQSRRNWR